MQTNSIAIIPARGGSKGLKKKNLQLFFGHPLIAWPIAAALKAKSLSKVIVSTDDIEIKRVAEEYGADVPFLRPDSVSEDLTTTEETLSYSLNEAERHYGMTFDYCVFLTCTDLFRKSGWIDMALQKLLDNPELESVFVGNVTHKNYWQYEDGIPTRLKPWMSKYESRQVRRKIFREDTGLSCASRSELWRGGKRIGDNVELIEDDRSYSSLDIHNEFDLYLANKAAEWLDTNDKSELPIIPVKQK